MAATTKKNDTKSFVYSTRIDIPVEIRAQVNTLMNNNLFTRQKLLNVGILIALGFTTAPILALAKLKKVEASS